MKKQILTLFVCVLMCSFVFAAQQGIHDAGTGIDNPEVKEAGQGTGQALNAEVTQQYRVKTGNYSMQDGKQYQIKQIVGNGLKLKAGLMEAKTSMNMTQEQNKLKVKLSNGKNSEIKIMPDTASTKALERLRLKVCSEENNCSIELKEVGQGNQTRAAYEVQLQKEARFLGMFKTKMKVNAQVDAENGEIIRTGKPWWAFLASESEE